MYKELIYKENKVFSTQLKRPEEIEEVMGEIRQKEDLTTAILVSEGTKGTNALFILENELYAAYCLDDPHFTPLTFSDYFEMIPRVEGEIQLYQVSPVLFKCLLILAQYSPNVVGTTAVLDIERILESIREKKNDAVLVFKQKSQVQIFYFMKGEVRDTYFEGQEDIDTSFDLEAQLAAATSQDSSVRIELFDDTDIHAAAKQEPPEQGIGDADISVTPETGAESTQDAAQENKAREHDTATPPSTKSKKEKPLSVKVLDGSRAGFLIRFSPDPVSLGRGNVAVRLNDPQVSRFHAELTWDENKLFIRDNHSTNGIFVNDKKVSRKPLILNDVIRLGDVRLKVVRGS